MNVREMVKEYLKKIGADGLYNGDYYAGGCGCGIDDLFPCDVPNFGECVPAKKRFCKDCDLKDECELYEEGLADKGYCYFKMEKENDQDKN